MGFDSSLCVGVYGTDVKEDERYVTLTWWRVRESVRRLDSW